MYGVKGGVRSTIMVARARGHKRGQRDALKILIGKAAFDATYGKCSDAKAALKWLHKQKGKSDDEG